VAFELRRQDQCVVELAQGFLSLNLDCHAHSRVVEALFSEFHAGGDNHAARKRGFDRISRSWCSTRFSRRSRINSARSLSVSALGGPSPASIAARLTQFRSSCSETPSSRATTGIDLPLVRTNATASAWNAAG
jgi:hypothetical protein